ncbi:MAG: prolyl oligopeptidase family serine peptidase [Candidatus Curtissbacteria bacterium]|nr:prolyl oligopeptidase family serine peptidase [Candidatus Curtissbacteria bacterium]
MVHRHVKRTFLILFITGLILTGLFGWLFLGAEKKQEQAIQQIKERIKPLERYTYENLSRSQYKPSEITIGEVLKKDPNYVSYKFYFNIDPQINSGQTKKVSGQLNVPDAPGPFPVIIMNRGFMEQEGYQSGDGTRRSSEIFATNGFITLAPDFLGFADSDPQSDNSIEDRFQTYVTVLTLLESIPNLNSALQTTPVLARADSGRVGLWGHSNGGQITLTALEITGKPYPTVLWAPVTKPFPYSIFYYTDEFDDHGKALRKAVADFEEDYDAENFSLTNYIDRINAPIQLHQGGADKEVPVWWSDDFVEAMEEKQKEVEYLIYPGEDHNFLGGSWNTIVLRNIAFYRQSLNEVK